MPTDTHAAADVIPEGAGLPAGPGPDGEPPARSRGDLIAAAAAGDSLDAREHDDLVSYYLENGELPGDTEPLDVTVKLGRGSAARDFPCTLRPISYDEWDDSRQRATNPQTGDLNTLTMAAYNVARALVRPKLGPTVQRLQQDDPERAPGDAAALLRRMFSKQAGALFELSAKVNEISKLANENGAVKEVEAAGN